MKANSEFVNMCRITITDNQKQNIFFSYFTLTKEGEKGSSYQCVGGEGWRNENFLLIGGDQCVCCVARYVIILFSAFISVVSGRFIVIGIKVNKQV